MGHPPITEKQNDHGLVILVDDEPDMVTMLQTVVHKKLSCGVLTAQSGAEALKLITEYSPDVVVTDIKMPDLDGLELLQKITKHDTTISTVIMTGYGTIDMAVQALKDGAYDFLQKPFEKDHIIRIISKCLERTALLRANRKLKEELSNQCMPSGFIGQSPALRKAVDLLSRIADTDATVLIQGESGTGKEVAAHSLHTMSKRSSNTMVIVNCPALPEHVLESELFGYSKGAFTGAEHDKKGLFLEAEGSSILLDEIADIPISVQTKLLRVLQEKEVQPLGQNKTIKVDVRVIASTNQDLQAKISKGEFREDLFYRLNVVHVVMPNLNEMREDIPLLIHHFLEKYKLQYSRPDLSLPPALLKKLYSRKWKGNVRELKNVIKRFVLVASDEHSQLENILEELQSTESHYNEAVPTGTGDLFGLPYNTAKAIAVERFSKEYISNLLTLHNGNVTIAAANCGLERQGLQRIMRKYEILSKEFKK